MRVLWLGAPQGAALLRQYSEEFEVATPSREDALGLATFGGADVVVAATWDEDALRMARGKGPSVQMVAVIPPDNRAAIREAVRAEVDDIVFALQDLPQALRTLPPPRVPGALARPEFQGRAITIVSAHGGAGRTTLAVNLAIALAQTGQPVILWDCVPHFGCAHIALGLDPAAGLDALRGPDEGDLAAQLVTPYDEVPLRLLPAPRSPETADAYTEPRVGAVLAALRLLAPWVVVDTERVPLPGLAPLWERADLLVVLARLGVAQARALRGYLDTVLRTYAADRLLLCATAPPKRPPWASQGVGPAALVEFAGIALQHVLPFDPAVGAADDAGVPVVLGAPRSRYARVIQTLGAAIAERLERAPGERAEPAPALAPAGPA